MDPSQQHHVTVLETCRISPPPGSVPRSLLPLTYYDVSCSFIPPVKRLFLYTFPCPTSDFLDVHVPNLKRSLSLALQRFWPLAGVVVFSGDVAESICYDDGDSVALTVAESGDDLSDLVGNQPREALKFRCLVSDLPTRADRQPVLALQVTVFPDRGIGVGLTTHHAAVDGSSTTHFMKTWASIHRSSFLDNSPVATMVRLEEVPVIPPSMDRSVVPDRERLLAKVVSRFRTIPSPEEVDHDPKPPKMRDTEAFIGDLVRATFVLPGAKLESLRRWVLTRTSLRCTDFVVLLASVWVCVVKASGVNASDHSREPVDGFAFFADSRGRPGSSLPQNYFGNCLAACVATMCRSELLGEDGMAKAAKAIWGAIQELKAEETHPMERDLMPVFNRVDTFQSVAGSPRLRVYELDFGWGKPRKVEVVSIDLNCAVSLAENESGGGGIELGVALPTLEMEKFGTLFHDFLLQHHL